MSPASEQAHAVHHAAPDLDEHRADVVGIGPWVPAELLSAPARRPAHHRDDDTVILGRSVPPSGPPSSVSATSLLDGIDGIDGQQEPPVGSRFAGSPIVDHGGLHRALMNRRERYYPAPPPPRVRHRSWMLSSVVIAGGGIAAVLAAGEFSEVPLVATVALIATVLCGALLVAAQVTEEIRRVRNQARRPVRAAAVRSDHL